MRKSVLIFALLLMRRTLLWSRSALAVLGLDETTNHSEEELKAAYHRQAKLLHPDAGGSAERFRELHEAYWSLRRNKKIFDGPPRADGSCDGSFCNNHDDHSEWSSASHFGGAHANKSTRSFYRPYTSSPFAHGFTSEEVLEAEQRSRIFFVRFIAKHGLLWGGFVYFVFVYFSENRVYRAVESRRHGHNDAAYWEKLEEDKRLGRTVPLQPHWTDVNSEEFASASSRETALRRRKALLFGGGGSYASRPVALTFQGRPFTPTGVRGARTNEVPKTSATYDSDVHYELDDFDDD